MMTCVPYQAHGKLGIAVKNKDHANNAWLLLFFISQNIFPPEIKVWCKFFFTGVRHTSQPCKPLMISVTLIAGMNFV